MMRYVMSPCFCKRAQVVFGCKVLFFSSPKDGFVCHVLRHSVVPFLGFLMPWQGQQLLAPVILPLTKAWNLGCLGDMERKEIKTRGKTWRNKKFIENIMKSVGMMCEG